MARQRRVARPELLGLLGILAALYVAGRLVTAQQPRTDESKDIVESDGSPAVDRYVRLQMERYGLPAVALAVLKDGRVLHKKAYGLANIELQVPARVTTLFQLSSTTKLFSATAMLRLVEQGRVGLDDSIHRYLPDLPEAWRPVSVRQLLSHTSGLPDLTPSVANNPRDSVLDSLRVLPMLNAPGEGSRYNQTNYFLLAIIAERVSGLRFEGFVERELFGPVGMTATQFAGGHHDVVPGRATSYAPDTDGVFRLRRFDFPSHAYAGAGLNSNLEDLIRFDRALDAGELLSASTRSGMWEQTVTADGQPSVFGVGWAVRAGDGTLKAVGHAGGFMTTVRKYPDVGLTVILLTNGYRVRNNPDVIADGVAAVFEPSAQEPSERLADEMWALISARDRAAAIERYRAFLRAGEATAAETGGAIARLGAALLAVDRADDAVMVLGLNVEAFPRGSRARQALGEALLSAGDTARAFERLDEAVSLDPGNVQAAQTLEALRGG